MKKETTIITAPYIKVIIKYFFLSIFLLYWILTIIYCSPENFIKIKMSGVLRTFDVLFPQQWSFFAPPPTFNNRVYFSYFDKDSVLLKSVEVFKPIVDKKQANAPFNFTDQIIDYSISSTIIQINDLIVQEKGLFQLKFKDSTELACSEMAKKEVAKFSNTLPDIQTLTNYSKIVLHNQNPVIHDAMFVKITITQADIPKFENRSKLLDEGYRPQESLLFTSTFISL